MSLVRLLDRGRVHDLVASGAGIRNVGPGSTSITVGSALRAGLWFPDFTTWLLCGAIYDAGWGFVEGGGSADLGLAFDDVQVPADATIESAAIEYTVDSITGGTAKPGTLYGRSGTAPAFNTGAPNPRTDANRTTATTAIAGGLTAGTYEFDFTDQMQELVDDAGWSSGDQVTAYIINGGDSLPVGSTTTDGEALSSFKLKVTYNES